MGGQKITKNVGHHLCTFPICNFRTLYGIFFAQCLNLMLCNWPKNTADCIFELALSDFFLKVHLAMSRCLSERISWIISKVPHAIGFLVLDP